MCFLSQISLKTEPGHVQAESRCINTDQSCKQGERSATTYYVMAANESTIEDSRFKTDLSNYATNDVNASFALFCVEICVNYFQRRFIRVLCRWIPFMYCRRFQTPRWRSLT